MHQKAVLVIGCSSGIGCSAALDFLGGEWEIYATARNPVDIETLGERDANITTLGVTDQGDVDRVADCIADGQGRIDCLVNNAGYDQMGPVEDVPTERVHDQFDMNVYGPHRLIRAMLPHIRSQGGDTIANAPSVIGRVAPPGTGVYAGSKFVLKATTDTLRAEVEEYGINAILTKPGPVETQFSSRVEAEASGNDDEADGLDRLGAYKKLCKLFDDSQAFDGNDPGAIPPERVTEDIVNAASSAKSRAHYRPGTVAHVGVLARFLPDIQRDALYGFACKLS